VRQTKGTRFFDGSKQEVFPKADFYCCTATDAFDMVLKLHDDGEIPYMKNEVVYVE